MAQDAPKVDGHPLPANFFKIKLASGKEVSVSGPVACDVRDGALVLVNADGKATIAWAPGLWLSVNAGD